MKKNFFGWLLLIVIILVVVGVVIKNWDWISGGFSSKKCKESDTPFACIKKKGAVLTTSKTAGDRYDYPDTRDGAYGFYDNNRAVIIGTNPQKKGTYNKERITWDDGGFILIENIFSK